MLIYPITQPSKVDRVAIIPVVLYIEGRVEPERRLEGKQFTKLDRK
jgi:hypothetical protein